MNVLKLTGTRLLAAFVLASLLVVANPAAAQTGNLLVDPSFEGESYVFVSADPFAPEVQYSVPAGWGGGVVLTPHDQTWQNIHPSGYPRSGSLVYAGNRSFEMARGFGTFTAYIFQTVSVQPGSAVEGGAFAYLFNPTGTSLVRAGIDPNGGGDPFSPSVVWSAFAGAAYQWNRVSVTATAGAGGRVTLFLYATQSQPGDPNAVYWDEAFLNGASATTPITNPAPAPTSQVAQPTAQVNVRTGPGTSFPRIARINPGESYGVIGTEGSWLIIDYAGQRGYVYAIFMRITTGTPSVVAPAPAPVLTGLVWTANAVTVRLRGGPATTFPILARIPGGGAAQIVGRTADLRWIQVSYGGVTGWVFNTLGRITGDVYSVGVTG